MRAGRPAIHGALPFPANQLASLPLAAPIFAMSRLLGRLAAGVAQRWGAISACRRSAWQVKMSLRPSGLMAGQRPFTAQIAGSIPAWDAIHAANLAPLECPLMGLAVAWQIAA